MKATFNILGVALFVYLGLCGIKSNVDLGVELIHTRWPDFPMTTSAEEREHVSAVWNKFEIDSAYRDGALVEAVCTGLDKLDRSSHVCFEHRARLHVEAPKF